MQSAISKLLGDSGSNLCFEINGSWTIRGIVSFSASKNCDGKSTVVYTDVAQFTDWIKETFMQDSTWIQKPSATLSSIKQEHLYNKYFNRFDRIPFTFKIEHTTKSPDISHHHVLGMLILYKNWHTYISTLVKIF